MRKIFFAIIIALLNFQSIALALEPSTYKADKPSAQKFSHRPKNIIFLIGDGMGLSQITYGMLNAQGVSNFSRFKNIGLIKTHSASEDITDSAAGATAFATGNKSYNGAIAVDANKKPLTTILELAEKKHLATGLVTTCAITHATPAAFIAHQPMRNLYEEIAADFLKTDIDIFIGGGAKYFTSRKDNQNLTEQLQKNGYKIYTDEKIFFADNYHGKTAALLAEDHLPKMQKGRKNYHEQALEKALQVVSQNKKGFFLMVEGSQIDWGGHENDEEYIKQEVLDFDRVIGKALDFAAKNKDTLVVVTADHETGGFALTGKNNFKTENYGAVTPKFTSKGHSASMVPVFAYGRGAEEFSGIYENTEIFWKMKKLLRI